jgi:uncharacterized protein (DUF924 family)
MPFMHSESTLIHIQAKISIVTCLQDSIIRLKHKAIIDLRALPHRNRCLAESHDRNQFLQPGSKF